MSLTREELALTIGEAAAALEGGRIDRVVRPHERRLVLEVYARGRRRHLLISVEPGLARAHLVSGRPRGLEEPGAFAMLLRKRLEGARVASLALLGADRVVRLEAHQGEARVTVLAELTGRHGNVFLLAPGEEIQGSLLRNLSHRRELRPGHPYQYPIPHPIPERPARFGDDAPGAAAEAIYAALGEEKEREGLRAELGRALRGEKKRVLRRHGAIREDMARAEDAERFRIAGELLVANFARVPRGAAEVTLTDYSVYPAAERVVALDPALSARANAERYFQRYRRYHDREGTISARLQGAEADLATLEALEVRLAEAGEEVEALEALRSELIERGLLRSRVGPAARARPADEPAQPFRRFLSKDGHSILVGKGAADNEVLTFRVARGNDLWLHTRDYPGSHVVVPLRRGQEVSEETLLDAATLAVHFSRAKGEPIADVSYTRRKFVHRPKGAPRGTVALSQARTLAVRLEPDRLERLLRRKDLR